MKTKNYNGHTLIVDLIPNNPFVLDLGGNQGQFAKQFMADYPNAFVISYEPTPGLLKSDRGNWIVVEKAIWTNDDGVVLHVNDKTWENSVLFKRDRKINVQSADILPIISASFFDVIKIDIEGAEYDVIKRGGSSWKNTKQLSVEFHCFLDEKLKWKTEATKKALGDIGFNNEDFDKNLDVLFL